MILYHAFRWSPNEDRTKDYKYTPLGIFDTELKALKALDGLVTSVIVKMELNKVYTTITYRCPFADRKDIINWMKMPLDEWLAIN